MTNTAFKRGVASGSQDVGSGAGEGFQYAGIILRLEWGRGCAGGHFIIHYTYILYNLSSTLPYFIIKIESSVCYGSTCTLSECGWELRGESQQRLVGSSELVLKKDK